MAQIFKPIFVKDDETGNVRIASYYLRHHATSNEY
jgi:hypothetical protein